MTLSRRFCRHMPVTLVLAIATASGCASSGQLGAGRLPYNQNAADRGMAARNPFPAETEAAQAAPQQPSLRTGVTGPQPPAMTATTWDRPAGTPQSIAAPQARSMTATATPPATSQAMTGQTGMPAATQYAAPPATAPPTAATHQTAYYEQPASGSAYPPPPSGGIQQMGYTTAIANDDPFAAVEGQTAPGVPVQQYAVPPVQQYSAPPATLPPMTQTTPIATATAQPSSPAPYEWGATTASDEFLPPIQQ